MTILVSKLYKILNFKEKKSIVIMFFLMLIAATFEVLSIGILIPLINVLFTENKVAINFIFFGIEDLKTVFSSTNLYIVLFSIILIVFFIKNIYLLFFQWWHTKQINFIKVRLANTLYSQYLNNSISFHYDNNSSKLIRNNHNEVGLLSKTLSLLVVISSESFAAAAILLFLFYLTPSGFFVTLIIIGLTGLVLNKVFKEKIILWGEQRLEQSNNSLKKLMEGFSGIKEIKNFSAENYFIKRFDYHQTYLANLSLKVHVLKYLPKILFEYVAIVSFVLLFLFFLFIQNINVDETVSILVIFSLAFSRIMPAANRLMVAIQSFQNFSPSIDVIYSEIKHTNPEIDYVKIKRNKKIFEFKNEINLKNISFSYSNSLDNVLTNFNMSIKNGESIGIIGESGRGKTTLINILLGQMPHTTGEIFIDGNLAKSPFFWDNSVGVVSQNIFLTDNTIKNNIAFGIDSDLIDIKKIEAALKIAQLDNFINNLPNGLMTIVGERGVKISGGQLQRLGIARALYHSPKLLIFDESTSQLDRNTEKKLMDLIYSLKKEITIIIVSHKLSTIEKCDKIINLNEY
jgi:ATP-binding cassette, subfamily B, bacterial PglK